MQSSDRSLNERLIIFTHVLHYEVGGKVLAHGPYANEINVLAKRFLEVVVVAPLVQKPQNISADNIPYSKKPRLISLPVAGGDNMVAKLGYIWHGPRLLWQIIKGISTPGILHVRAPGSVALIALFLMSWMAKKKRKFAKFAGEWDAPESLPTTFRWQRQWLANSFFFNGPVFVYSTKLNSSHIIPSFTSNLTIDDIQLANLCAAEKIWGDPWILVFAGRLVKNKGVDVLLQALAMLKNSSGNWKLLIMGDGIEKATLQKQASELGIASQVMWLGWCSQQDMMKYMREAHLICQPTRFTESWGKVLQEGMAFGCIPVASAVGGLKRQLKDKPQLLFEPGNAPQCAAIIRNFIDRNIDYREAMEWSLAQSRLYSLDALADFIWNKYDEYYA